MLDIKRQNFLQETQPTTQCSKPEQKTEAKKIRRTSETQIKEERIRETEKEGEGEKEKNLLRIQQTTEISAGITNSSVARN